MGTARSLFAITRADLLQRVRSHSFLVVVVLTVLSAWRLVPPAGSARAPMHFGPARALNTAAGIGASVACMCIIWLGLIGFYLVSSAVRCDEVTGVGQIIATTQIGKATYLLGKALSNFAVLLSILGTVCITSLAVLAVKGEGGAFDVAALCLPMLALGAPPLALVSALAVMSEVLLPRLRGLVNVAYFFLLTLLIVATMDLLKEVPLGTAAGQIGDLFAMREVTETMEGDLLATHPDHKRGQVAINFPFSDKIDTTFEFRGFHDVWPRWAERWTWVAVAVLLVAAVAVPFRRFDPVIDKRLAVRAPSPGAGATATRWRPSIPAVDTGSPHVTLVQSELRLLMLGRSRCWWLVTGALLVASATAPLSAAHHYILPGLWFWQILALSQLGSREVGSRTTEIVFVAPRPLARQLPASLGAGVLLLLTLGLPVLLRELLAGSPDGALGVVAGAVFLPAMALALGTWTNGGKMFELLFTILWYGAMNDAPPLDFTGALAALRGSGTALAYLALAGLLTLAAVPGRMKQLRGL